MRLPTTPSTGGDDGRVGEVELGLVLHRLVVGERRLRLGELGLENVELLGRVVERRVVAGDGGAAAGNARRGLLGVLHAAVAVGGELGVALVVLLGEGQVRLVDGDRRLRGIDDGLLGGRARPACVGNRRLRGRDIGLGLVERDPEIAIVDLRQDLPGLDRLVVADKHGAM